MRIYAEGNAHLSASFPKPNRFRFMETCSFHISVDISWRNLLMVIVPIENGSLFDEFLHLVFVINLVIPLGIISLIYASFS